VSFVNIEMSNMLSC